MFITEEPVKAGRSPIFALLIQKHKTVLVNKLVFSPCITNDLDLLSQPGIYLPNCQSHVWEKWRMETWRRNPNCCRLSQLPTEQTDCLTGSCAAEGRKKILFSEEIRLPRSNHILLRDQCGCTVIFFFVTAMYFQKKKPKLLEGYRANNFSLNHFVGTEIFCPAFLGRENLIDGIWIPDLQDTVLLGEKLCWWRFLIIQNYWG